MSKTFSRLYPVLLVLLIATLACGQNGNAPSDQTNIEPAKTQELAKIPEPTGTSGVIEPTTTKQSVVEPTMTPATEKTQEIGMVGAPTESSGISITALSTEKAKSFSDFATADDGKTYLAVDVVITNVSRDEAPYNSLYFKVKDSSGYEYNASLFSREPSLKTGDLRKGESARGHIAFEVQEDATGFVLSYEPLVLFSDYQVIRVDLEKKSEAPVPTISSGVSFDDAAKVGDRAESGGIAITINAMKRLGSISAFNADAGNMFVDLDVTIENVSRTDPVPYNTLYFKAKDANGFEYNPSMWSLEPSLKTGDLNQGDKSRGHISFEVPTTITKLLITYEPLVLFSDYKIVRFVIDVPAQ